MRGKRWLKKYLVDLSDKTLTSLPLPELLWRQVLKYTTSASGSSVVRRGRTQPYCGIWPTHLTSSSTRITAEFCPLQWTKYNKVGNSKKKLHCDYGGSYTWYLRSKSVVNCWFLYFSLFKALSSMWPHSVWNNSFESWLYTKASDKSELTSECDITKWIYHICSLNIYLQYKRTFQKDLLKKIVFFNHHFQTKFLLSIIKKVIWDKPCDKHFFVHNVEAKSNSTWRGVWLPTVAISLLYHSHLPHLKQVKAVGFLQLEWQIWGRNCTNACLLSFNKMNCI